jgi:hypothetical protein
MTLMSPIRTRRRTSGTCWWAVRVDNRVASRNCLRRADRRGDRWGTLSEMKPTDVESPQGSSAARHRLQLAGVVEAWLSWPLGYPRELTAIVEALEDDEVVLKAFASYLGRWSLIGGLLILTDRRLIHVRFRWFQRRLVSIPFSAIRQARVVELADDLDLKIENDLQREAPLPSRGWRSYDLSPALRCSRSAAGRPVRRSKPISARSPPAGRADIQGTGAAGRAWEPTAATHSATKHPPTIVNVFPIRSNHQHSASTGTTGYFFV